MTLRLKNPLANAGELRDAGSILGLGRSPGGEHGNTFQYSCLVNPMDRGVWWDSWDRKESNTTEGLSPHTQASLYPSLN